MSTYRVLNKQIFSNGSHVLVPIRFEDRYDIMKWRNEQIYHLRQAKILTKKDQEAYFNNVIANLFKQDRPEQILFSFLENGVCIGYGGLVHIQWPEKIAEISFIMDTSLEEERFMELWQSFLQLIEEVAFKDLMLDKICTYAFDLRPHLYEVLEQLGFKFEVRLKEHYMFSDKFIDVVIHSKEKNYDGN